MKGVELSKTIMTQALRIADLWMGPTSWAGASSSTAVEIADPPVLLLPADPSAGSADGGAAPMDVPEEDAAAVVPEVVAPSRHRQ